MPAFIIYLHPDIALDRWATCIGFSILALRNKIRKPRWSVPQWTVLIMLFFRGRFEISQLAKTA
jgi:hypothetical protein